MKCHVATDIKNLKLKDFLVGMIRWQWVWGLIIVGLAIAACGGNQNEDSPPAKLRVVGDLATATPTVQVPTNTPLPTPLPTMTPFATPRRVHVTRINENADLSTAQLLEEGNAVPPIVLTDIDGNNYQLDQLKGRVVVVNFWTLGCGSCFYEFPFLQQAYDMIPNEEILILGINVSDLAQQTRILANSIGIEFPMIVDPQGAVFATYFGGAVVPTTYFIDQDGAVFDVVVGPMDMYNLSDRLNQLGLDIQLPETIGQEALQKAPHKP
jgi:cytochrome c biogenesis protein CcmG/thiol:disulfide interchange protein DsbE